LQTVPAPLQTLPTPLQTVPTPLQTLPTPLQTVPVPLQTLPGPLQTVPTPLQTVLVRLLFVRTSSRFSFWRLALPGFPPESACPADKRESGFYMILKELQNTTQIIVSKNKESPCPTIFFIVSESI
jgi:hypothetical protein